MGGSCVLPVCDMECALPLEIENDKPGGKSKVSSWVLLIGACGSTKLLGCASWSVNKLEIISAGK